MTQLESFTDDLNSGIDPMIVIKAIMGYYSGGINWRSKYNNCLELVEFLDNVIGYENYGYCDSLAEKRLYFCRNLKAVSERLITCIDDTEKLHLESLLFVAINYPDTFEIKKALNLLLANWDTIKNDTFTYRLLYALCDILVGNFELKDIKKIENIITKMATDWE